MNSRYDPAGLIVFARTLLVGGGHDVNDAQLIAETLVEADLLGHTTHGLQLLPAYVKASSDGTMTVGGKAAVLSDVGAVVVWDGEWRSGIVLIRRALQLAMARARKFGTCVVSIRRSHHTACLEAYLQEATDEGLVVSLMCSDPGGATVAPYGGVEPVLQPDPMAFGIPTRSEPILIDMSTSITSNALVNRLAAAGERLPGPWVQDSSGSPTDDPTVVNSSPPGTLLPIGGHDHGYKGYALALAVESLSQGLSGYGRKNAEARWGASVLLQVYDPRLFTGVDEFEDQTQSIADAAKRSRPNSRTRQVRIPGASALENKRASLRLGVTLSEPIVSGLKLAAADQGVEPPEPVPS